MGRLVLNHGLIPILKMLQTSPAIKTVIPGRIFTTNSRKSLLTIKVLPRGPNNIEKQKLLAMTKTSIQEIFLVPYSGKLVDTGEVQQHLQEILGDRNCKIVRHDGKISNKMGQTIDWQA